MKFIENDTEMTGKITGTNSDDILAQADLMSASFTFEPDHEITFSSTLQSCFS